MNAFVIEGLQHNDDETVWEEGPNGEGEELHEQREREVVHVGVLTLHTRPAAPTPSCATTQAPALPPVIHDSARSGADPSWRALSGIAEVPGARLNSDGNKDAGVPNAALPSRRLAALKRLSTPAFADPLAPDPQSTHAHAEGLALQACVPAAGCTNGAAVTDVVAAGGSRAVGAGQALKGRASRRRLTEEISECLQLFRQRDGAAGLTPSDAARGLPALSGRVHVEGAGTPTSRMLKSPVKMFTYQARSEGWLRALVRVRVPVSLRVCAHAPAPAPAVILA